MVESSFSTAVFCIVSAFLAVMLRRYCQEQSLMLALAACTVIFGGFMYFLSPMLGEISAVFTQAGISDSYISLIFKAGAICFITQLTCELCRDSGEHAIASAAELWGRCALTLMSIPLIKAVVSRIGTFLGDVRI